MLLDAFGEGSHPVTQERMNADVDSITLNGEPALGEFKFVATSRYCGADGCKALHDRIMLTHPRIKGSEIILADNKANNWEKILTIARGAIPHINIALQLFPNAIFSIESKENHIQKTILTDESTGLKIYLVNSIAPHDGVKYFDRVLQHDCTLNKGDMLVGACATPFFYDEDRDFIQLGSNLVASTKINADHTRAQREQFIKTLIRESYAINTTHIKKLHASIEVGWHQITGLQ